MNINKLRGKIVESGMNVEKLAESIGLHPSSLYRKLNDAEKITIGEAIKMKKALSMSDSEASEIFLV